MQRFLTQAQAVALAAPLMTVALTTLLGAPARAQSTQYNFTRIADTAGTLSSFAAQVSLNNNGTVAFRANLDAGGVGLFTGSGGPTTTIAATTAAGGQFLNLSTSPTINNAGTVAFAGSPTTAGSGVFVSSGGSLTTLAITGAGSPLQSFSSPAINERGQVAFRASPDGIYVVDSSSGGGQVSTLATGQSVGFGSLGAQFAFNNLGVVAFTGVRVESPTALFLGSGGPPVRLADNTGPLANFGAPALNDAGVVAFQANLDAGGDGLFSVLNGQLTTLGDATSPLVGFGDPAINNTGQVAFRALVRGGGNASAALFTAAALPMGPPNLAAGRVIGVGDVLDGSTVTAVGARAGFNDQGQIAFTVGLADGRAGLYRANPTSLAEVIPEPGTLALLVTGGSLAGLMAVRRRRAVSLTSAPRQQPEDFSCNAS